MQKTFDKANSFQDLRRKGGDSEKWRARLEAYLKRVPQAGAVAGQESIARMAAEELLEKGEGHFFLREQAKDELERVDDKDLTRFLFYRYRYDVYPLQNKLD